jgi:two-component system CheB/CheR fusion protein
MTRGRLDDTPPFRRELVRVLREKIIPDLMTGKGPAAPIRVWVPGCGSGEEAYSIAICLLEYLAGKPTGVPIKIFATDTDQAALALARAGIYTQRRLQHTLPPELMGFFDRVDGNYKVPSRMRELCVFARHELGKDPPFSNLDLIRCRHLLNHFEPGLHKQALVTFYRAL